MTVTESVVGDYQNWALRLARALLGSSLRSEWAMDYEDLAQIGLLAMWEAEKNFDPTKGALPAYLTLRGRGAMKNALRQREKHALYKYSEDVTLLAEDEDLVEEQGSLYGDFQEDEIAVAVAGLPPRQREYVIERFWKNKHGNELKAHFGYEPHALWFNTRNGAKHKLADALVHLRETE